MYNQIFFTNILRIIEELGLTKTDLAVKSGVSVSYISDLTNDNANPSLKTMEAIADALETPLPVLLEITDLDAKTYDLLLDKHPRHKYPSGYTRVCAVLNEFQAFKVKGWDAENRKRVTRKK